MTFTTQRWDHSRNLGVSWTLLTASPFIEKKSEDYIDHKLFRQTYDIFVLEHDSNIPGMSNQFLHLSN